MIEKAIRKILVDSGAAESRVYPVVKPQDATTFPLFVYERISTERPHSHGPARASGLGIARVQIRTWAKSYAEARKAAEEARLALDGFVGEVTLEDGEKIEVQAILADDDRDDYDEETRTFGNLFDVRVWWTEASPS